MSTPSVKSSAESEEYTSEDKFEKKYFGYIIKRIKLDSLTASGNQKFKVFVGRECEVLYEHIMIKFYSKTFNKYQNIYTAKPYNINNTFKNKEITDKQNEAMKEESDRFDSMITPKQLEQALEALNA